MTRGLAHAANAIIAQRLWLVIAVLTTTVVAYGISYVIASSHICFKGVVTMSWKSVVKQCRSDCVGTGLFSVGIWCFCWFSGAVYRGIAGDDIDPCR